LIPPSFTAPKANRSERPQKYETRNASRETHPRRLPLQENFLVPDPKKHADSRNIIESIARWIPGFSGYLEKEYRRESDALARKWLADRLDKAKPALDQLMEARAAAGELDGLDLVEKLRSKIDHLVGRFRSAPQGYSGFFDFVRIRKDALDDVYATDAALFSVVDGLAKSIESMKSESEPLAQMIQRVTESLEDVSSKFDRRGEILSGLADENPTAPPIK